MSAIEIIYMVTISILALASVFKNRMDSVLIRMYKKELDRSYSNTDEVIEFCLVKILQDAIEKEDYETADRCQKAIKELSKPKP